MLSLVVAAVALVPMVGCTVDDAIEGKPCDIQAPREKQCVEGYECVCEAEGCFCRHGGQSMSLTEPPLMADPPVDPNALFLHRRFPDRLPLLEASE